MSTLAGFAGGSGSADGAATAARFNYPQGVAVDSAGNIYVADTDNHTIRKITSTGVVTTPYGLASSAGSANGTGSVARFRSPQGVTVDSVGNVYVADTGNNTIRKITPDGSVSNLAGCPPITCGSGSSGSADGTGNAARFSRPKGVTVDSAGNIYVGDTSNFTIRKITPAGVVSTLAGLPGSSGSADNTGSAARFNGPEGVAVDNIGNVYVADAGNHTIRNVTPACVVTTLAGLAGNVGSFDRTYARFDHPEGVAVDNAGNVYVADTNNSTIRKITPAGVVTPLAGCAACAPGSADGTGSTARFRQPRGMAVGIGGNVYVADSVNHTIRRITSAGVVSTLAGLALNHGSDDGTGSAARFYRPYGVAVDSAENVYVADTWNHTIRKITSAGVVTTLAGLAGSSGSADGTGDAARFYYPGGLALDTADNVYVADTYNHAIRKITPAGVVTTLAGLPGFFNSGSADGTGDAARFYCPGGLALDTAENLYVADTYNYTIRKITSAGVVTTLAGLAGSSGSADDTGGFARFDHPAGVAVDNAGNVYVADINNSTIRKITPGRVVTTLAGLATVGSTDATGNAARFYYPIGVAVDSTRNVYVGDTFNHTIRKITPVGVVATLAGLAGSPGSADGTGSAARFDHPAGVAVDNAGNVYVADSNNSTIRKITPAGVVSTPAGLAGSSGSVDGTGNAARFYYPIDVAVDSAGNVYVADYLNDTVRKITPAGVVSTLAGLALNPGSDDGTGGFARFDRPEGVAVDNAGNVYVADSSNRTIRKITPAGDVGTLAGSAGHFGSNDGTGSAARFGQPTGVAVDNARNVYVADTYSQTIRKITSAGTVTTLAGSAGSYGSNADGTGSAARFGKPRGVAVDTGGNVYVADTINHSIRKGAPPPFINSPPIAIGTVGLEFIYQIQAEGATSFGATNLPPGLNVDTTLGIIYGIPTTAGTFQVTITASTPQHTTTAMLTITIQPAPSSGPVIASGSSVGARTAGVFAFNVLTIGSAPSNITASGLPPGLNIDSLTGLIYGTPTADGSSLVTLAASDATGTHTTTLQLTLVSDPSVPIITSSDDAVLMPGQFFSRTITADAAATFSYVGIDGQTNGTLPPGLSFTPPATISGTYKGPGILPLPDTIKIRPPLVGIIQTNARNSNGTGTRPLNFFQPAVVSRSSSAAGVNFDMPLPLTGTPAIESRGGGASGDYQIIFAFPRAVSFSGVSVSAGKATVARADGDTNGLITVNLTGVANAQTITLTLGGVSGGTSTVSVQMRILVGDVNGDGVVNSADAILFRIRSGQSVNSTNFRSDVNGDGVINSGDATIVRARSGTGL